MSDQGKLFAELCADFSAQAVLLRDKPEETVDSTVRALWFVAADMARSAENASDATLPELSMSQLDTVRVLLRRRIAGEPLAHLTGRQSFMGIEMLAGPEALIPRKETELLGFAALELLKQTRGTAVPMVIDICTGSGNVPLALLKHAAPINMFASDLSEAAIDLARRNAQHLGIQSLVEFRVGDLLAPFDQPAMLGHVDLLTCNPPYISSGKVSAMATEIAAHEPRLAFDGGGLGIGILMRLVQEAPRFLRSGGWLAFEVGLGQGPALVKRVKANSAYQAVETVADDANEIRVIMARC